MSWNYIIEIWPVEQFLDFFFGGGGGGIRHGATQKSLMAGKGLDDFF